MPNFHVTLLMDVSPLCDCHSANDLPIIPNVGFFASADPVALDRACAEIAQEQPMVPGSVLDTACNHVKPEDIFAVTNPHTHWQSHIEHAEKIGMGNGEYKIVEIK
ncbi:MAG: DUF362 domain-containing protein, partial [archaeon]|nr:DUF362 domain-containing protein [archaeon]